MFNWRITKYNPKYRDMQGAYLEDEWTSYSDIGRSFQGKNFTFDDYIKIENAYVESIFMLMDCLNLEALIGA